jgi:hypothetical protein
MKLMVISLHKIRNYVAYCIYDLAVVNNVALNTFYYGICGCSLRLNFGY